MHVTDDYEPEKLSIMIITDLDIQTDVIPISNHGIAYN